MQDSVVKAVAFDRFLDASQVRRTKWARAGILRQCEHGFYALEEVDRFLRESAHNFGDSPPTWHAIRSGAVVFVPSLEVQAYLGLNESQIRDWRDKLGLEYLKFPGLMGHVRYSRQSLVRAKPQLYPGLPVGIALRATGLARVHTLLKFTGIRRAYGLHRGRGRELYVCEADLVNYLKEHLPPWISPEEWIDECASTDERLMTAHDAGVALGIPRRKLREELDRRGAYYVMRPQDSRAAVRVLPSWVRAEVEHSEPLEAHEVARLFDVGVSTPRTWEFRGHIVCPIPGHVHAEGARYLYRSCWVAILQAGCSANLRRTMSHFVASRLATANPKPLLSLSQAAAYAGVSPATLVHWMRRRAVPYISSPTGAPLFLEAWVRRFRDSPKYHYRPLTAQEVGRLFDVDSGSVTDWQRAGRIRCSVQGHVHDTGDRFLWRSCWIAYLKSHCTQGIQGEMEYFFESRLATNDPPPLLSLRAFAARVGREQRWLSRRIDEGRIEGVWLPNGRICFTEDWITRAGLFSDE